MEQNQLGKDAASVLISSLKQIVLAIHDKPLGLMLPIHRPSAHGHIQGRFIHATAIQAIPDP
jgi:hypothetical protein